VRRIVHHELGQPAQVLRVEEGPSESNGPDQVRVRVSYAPIHAGDLLGVMGSPPFGTSPTITSDGRVPGFEGAGVVSEVGVRIDPGLGLKPGLRVAFFPARGSWRDEVVVPASSVVPLPDSIPDKIGAQMLINTATALTAIRAAHDSLPVDARTGVVVLLTAAGSAVGRLLGKLLSDRGVKVIRLVPSEAGAEKLAKMLPGSPFLRQTLLAGRTTPGRPLRERRFTPRSTASAGACWATSRSFCLKGPGPPVNLGSRAGRRATSGCFRPALSPQGRVPRPVDAAAPGATQSRHCARSAARARARVSVRGRYPPSRISNAVAHVSQPGRAGVVLWNFTRD
jgi:NADPH:quinone reductase